MASSSNRKSGSSARSTTRKRVVIGADETVRVRYAKGQPKVDSERKRKQARTPKRPDSAGARLSKAKRQEREKRVSDVQRKRVLIALVAIGLVVAAWYLAKAFVSSPVIAVQAVDVRGNARVSSAQVASEAAIPVGTTLLTLDANRIAQRVEVDPWVQSAAVSRQFPHTVVITVQERRPVAYVDVGGGKTWLVSNDGRWLAPRSGSATGTLITVRDAPGLIPAPGAAVESTELANALQVVAGLSHALSKTVAVVTAPSVENTALITKANVEIFIGSAAEIAKKDKIARTILAQQKGRVVYVNVRTTDRPTWRGLGATP